VRRKTIETIARRVFSPHASRLTPCGIAAVLIAAILSGCGSMGTRESAPVARVPDGEPAAVKPAPPRTGGGYYLNDGPGDNPPANIEQIPDAVPRLEPLRAATMRPYTVMGQTYTPMTRLAPYKQRGIASWYGRRYHDQKTSSGEIYDMYGMSAAHTTLPIPSYARVTNLANKKSVVVRINDRGPFHSDRLIDLSYTAAYKLGVLGGGSALVEVETIIPDGTTPSSANIAAAPAVIETPVVSPPPPEPVVTNALAKNETPAPTPVVAVTSDAKGVFLQLAAFGSQDNADNYLARLRAQVEWLAPSLHVYAKDNLFRVHAGPYASQAEARAAAEKLNQTLGIKAVVLSR